MRAVIQRVLESKVEVNGETIGKINNGIMLLLGVKDGDTEKDFDYIYRKTVNLRIFDDEEGVMNKSIKDVGGEILVISQFTLYGDARKGNRPSYVKAAKFEEGKEFYSKFIAKLEEEGIHAEHGEYGADMKVSLVNDGPVTILLDSEKVI